MVVKSNAFNQTQTGQTALLDYPPNYAQGCPSTPPVHQSAPIDMH